MALYGQVKRDYQNAWMKKRRQDWIDSKGGKCVKCGSTESLEVDHIDRTLKTCNPARIWSRTKTFRDIELANCQVLCYDCHKIKTISESSAGHGSYASYKRGCKCEDCMNAMRIEWRRRRSMS